MEILLLLIFFPFLISFLCFVLPDLSSKSFKRLAFVFSLIPLVFLIINLPNWIGTQVSYDWLPALSVQFFLSVDGLSLVFLFLAAIVIPITILSMRSANVTYPHTFYGLIFLLEGLLFGFFTARDLALFTIFWEAMLLPLYFIITLWGGPKRQSAAFKFIIYMIAGSALMIAAVLSLYFAGGTFNLDALSRVAATAPYAPMIAAIFFIAFAVKTPLFPFHAWLPDAYYQAPTAGTILLSAILSKAGIYGFLRVGLELYQPFLKAWEPLLLTLAIAGVFYGGLAAWQQYDFKRLIAYSSFSHVNFILAGIFAVNATAETGAILQAINHGITITALFLVADWLAIRLGTTLIPVEGGLAKFMPALCWLTLFFVLSSVALPGTNSFIGELIILFGVFKLSAWMAAILSLSVILSVMYMLRWMQTTYFGPAHETTTQFKDIKTREFVIATPLVALILWIGLYPAPILDIIKRSTGD